MACSVRNGGVCLPPLGALDLDLASSSTTPSKTSRLGSYLRLSSRITPKEEITNSPVTNSQAFTPVGGCVVSARNCRESEEILLVLFDQSPQE